jgi:hypothetical protein
MYRGGTVEPVEDDKFTVRLSFSRARGLIQQGQRRNRRRGCRTGPWSVEDL